MEDLNGDGSVDIVLAGNDYGLDVETGRIDAGEGLVLLGPDFKVVTGTESGFQVPGDVRDMEWTLTSGGEKRLIVVQNNGPVKGFRIK